MKKTLIFLLGVLLTTPAFAQQANQICNTMTCMLNQNGTPVCAVMCPDGYVYRWYPTDRVAISSIPN